MRWDHYRSRNRRDGITSRYRLRGYDYSTPGYYFVTICTENRLHRYGKVIDDRVWLSRAGEMVGRLWSDVPDVFPDIHVDSAVTMPNHVHAIIGIGIEYPQRTHAPLTDVVHWYKSLTTTRYIRGVRDHGWPRFEDRLWQKGYHDHIVRGDRDLDRLREYVEANPALWPQDTFFDLA